MITVDSEATGKNIKEAIAKSGKSVYDIAEEMFIDPDNLYRWCKGKRMPTLENTAIIADLTGVTIDDLVVTRRVS